MILRYQDRIHANCLCTNTYLLYDMHLKYSNKLVDMSNIFNRNVVDRSLELTAKVCVPYMYVSYFFSI